ncbi:SDR family oxidoreductase [Halieaceae bacterium IMCC14734]|uniref:SDR family oxidoreductase n=1 Tax=Candidatus Litorirhabdus singularis TaxID=2518993 RepID=A0ABT3TLF8_9GAMM|nr:SDR family oxidoreductase [Candidatus Litorirhabdus singularis]MCX2983158.1 SDR family oxidoreductase [Candidatus Litorirhabdus singularis]
MATVTGKVVVLTGGAGDIARVAAKRFLAGGASVMLVDLDADKLAAVCSELDSKDVAHCAADVTDLADTQRYIKAAVERFGRIDVLLANAGIEGQVAPVSEYDPDVFRKVLDVNVTGPFLGIREVFPVMAANGGGSIVITSSIAGLRGSPGLSAYNASKHAVIGLMRSTAVEGGPLNIRVNTINPSPVEGRMIRSLEEGNMPDAPEAVREIMEASIPLRRYAVPEDVVNLMMFLAGDESQFLTGAVYPVDGGMSA